MRGLLVAAAGALVATAVLATPASADHAWGGYHWARTANPFTIQLGDNVDASWDFYLVQAASDWSANIAGNPVNATVVPAAARIRNCRPTLGRVEVCNARYGARGWSGLATIWLTSGGHIAQGTAQMNDTYMRSRPAAAHAHVMCQEVGHTFGLDHQDESGADLNTCMDYARAFDNEHPNWHDYEQLALIYDHLDRFTTIGAAGGAGAAANPAAAPYRVERSERRHSTRVVEYFADGTKKITVIDWVD